jgi:hypothetical protein
MSASWIARITGVSHRCPLGMELDFRKCSNLESRKEKAGSLSIFKLFIHCLEKIKITISHLQYEMVFSFETGSC